MRDDDCQGDWPVAYAGIAGIRAAEEADVLRGQFRRRERRPLALRSCRVADTGRALVCVPDRDQTCEAVEGTASEQAAKLAKIIEGWRR